MARHEKNGIRLWFGTAHLRTRKLAPRVTRAGSTVIAMHPTRAHRASGTTTTGNRGEPSSYRVMEGGVSCPQSCFIATCDKSEEKKSFAADDCRFCAVKLAWRRSWPVTRAKPSACSAGSRRGTNRL